MTCKECDRFCRFPKNPKNGICAEIVQEIISENTNCKAVYVTEESKCYQPWYYPQKAEPIVEEKQTDSETEYWKERAKSYERTIVALQKGIAEQTNTAEWIKQGYGIGYKCTNCGKIVMADDSNELNFCCNCGAKMKGV